MNEIQEHFMRMAQNMYHAAYDEGYKDGYRDGQKQPPKRPPVKILCQCSRCGHSETTSAMYGVPQGMWIGGWRAIGDAAYCPDCVKKWPECHGGMTFDEIHRDSQRMFANWWNNEVAKAREKKAEKNI